MDGLRCPVGVVIVVVVALIVDVGDIELQHVHVQFVFGEEVDGFQHSLLVFRTLVAVATETAVCHLVVLLGLQVGDGNILAVHTGI